MYLASVGAWALTAPIHKPYKPADESITKYMSLTAINNLDTAARYNTNVNIFRTSIYTAINPENNLPKTDPAVTNWTKYVPCSHVNPFCSKYFITQSKITFVPVALQTMAKFANKTAGLSSSYKKRF